MFIKKKNMYICYFMVGSVEMLAGQIKNKNKNVALITNQIVSPSTMHT